MSTTPLDLQPSDLTLQLEEKVKKEYPLLCHFNPAVTAQHMHHTHMMTGRKTVVSSELHLPFLSLSGMVSSLLTTALAQAS